MEISEELNSTRFWVTELSKEISELESFYAVLDEETVEDFSGKKTNILDDVLKHKIDYQPSSYEERKQIVPESSLELNYVAENKSMNSQLEQRLDILKEAINILDTTESNPSKLEYLTSNLELNPHLIDIGYVNIVENNLKEQIAAFTKENKLKYFKIKPSIDTYMPDNKININVSLQGFGNLITLYTHFRISDKSVTYPQYMNTGYHQQDKKKALNRLTSEYNNLTTENKAYGLFISDLESGMFGKSTNKTRIRKYKLLINDNNKEIVRYYIQLLKLKDEILDMENAITRFYEELPLIEKEQDLIFDYLSKLLNKKVIKHKLTLN